MSRLWQSLVSVWTWLVLVACVLLWLPLMALVRLATLGDPGRYWVGYLFRRIGPTVAALNPLWKFSYGGACRPIRAAPTWSSPITSPSPTSCSSAISPGR